MNRSEGDCAFIRDISGLQPHLNQEWFSQPHLLKEISLDNSDDGVKAVEPLTLAQMLTDFFEFYAEFDFEKTAVCLANGSIQGRRNLAKVPNGRMVKSRSIDVINPLSPDISTTANVSKSLVVHFQQCCSSSLRKMFALNELQTPVDGGRTPLNQSKLSYVVGTDNQDITLSKVYGMSASSESSVRADNNQQQGLTRGERRQKEQLKKKITKIRVKDLF